MLLAHPLNPNANGTMTAMTDIPFDIFMGHSWLVM
jgi:hypothetical protein